MQVYIGDIAPMSTVGFQKNTCTEISFAGCNFNCPFCNRADVLSFKPEFLMSMKELKKDLVFDNLFITGGEPTLQKDALVELCRFAKSKGAKVGLDTNGSRPDVIRKALRYLDFVSLDLKTPFDPHLFEKVTKSSTFFVSPESIMADIKSTLNLLEKSDVRFELVTTIVPGLIFRKEDFLEIAENVSLTRGAWVLQGFSAAGCSNKMYVDLSSPTRRFLETLRNSACEKYPVLSVSVR